MVVDGAREALFRGAKSNGGHSGDSHGVGSGGGHGPAVDDRFFFENALVGVVHGFHQRVVLLKGPGRKEFFHGQAKPAVAGGVKFDYLNFGAGSLGKVFDLGHDLLDVFFRSEASVDDDVAGFRQGVWPIEVGLNVGDRDGGFAKKFVFGEFLVEGLNALDNVGDTVDAVKPLFGICGMDWLAAQGDLHLGASPMSAADSHAGGGA